MNLKANNITTFISAGNDLQKAVNFYTDIGFTVDYTDDEIAIMVIDESKFILQKYPAEWMHGNFMIILEVNDADAWYEKLKKLNLNQKYPGANVREPQNFSWGKRICHLTDLNGVLWHIASEIKKSL
ncbi:VOC family protein [Flavobacterium dauae]|uniref:VOC family protein n=1 Tax=Flavobacterium dauae TaxID=1563479 RepID=UPI00101B303F|nr:VOC family protein [Flavobacterium dauae]WLD25075.1 VOC family protein [Flavobacterium dauae]